jgi:hypothetical protein
MRAISWASPKRNGGSVKISYLTTSLERIDFS